MFETEVIYQVLDVAGYAGAKFHCLGGYYNNVYEIEAEQPIVVKIYHRTIHDEALIVSEMEWIQHLHDNEVHTVEPILIDSESYINPLPDGYYFVAFNKVLGIHIDANDSSVWNNELFYKWGSEMGRMHALSHSYKGCRRPEWNQQNIFQSDLALLDPVLKIKWDQYSKELSTMRKTKSSYGVIHGDLHHHNFLVNNDQLTMIDFGDSEYNWFPYDVAIAVFHAAQTVQDISDRRLFAKVFFDSFMTGYALHFPVEDIMKQVDYFIDFRFLYSYVYHMEHADHAQLTQSQKKYLEDMRQSLLTEESFLGMKVGHAELRRQL